jgi:hypothetical protein
MEKSELNKQFQVTLYSKEILITTPSNNKEAYQAELNLPVGKEIKVGWHDWIETGETALNYYECCGVLILFGITPPSLDALHHQLTSQL